MNTDNGALSFDAYINNTDFKRQIDEMNARIKGLSSSTVKETKKMDDAFGGLGKTVMALGSTALLAGFARQLVTVRGEFQKLDVAFTTMLGSKEKSDALMAQIVDTAAKTPFTLTEVANGAKQLLAYKVAADKVNETVIRLGNISAGVGVPLGQLVAVYGQVKAKGRLMGDDMRQFMNAGIPIVSELAKVMGIADEEVQKLVTDGKVGFEEVQKVVERLTNEGGMFFNLMEKQSKTLSGQLSNLQDAWDRMLNKIGEGNEGLLSGIIGGATFAVEHYKEILDIIIPLVSAYGTYKAALLATVAAQKAAMAFTMAKEYIAMARALGMATANQMMFNKATLANPYALAAAAVVGLSVAIYKMSSTLSIAEEAQKRYNDAMDKAKSDVDEEKGSIESLTAIINNENISRDIRNQKLKELIALNPQMLDGLTLENIKTKEGTELLNNYIKVRERQIKTDTLKAQLDESIRKKQAAESGQANISGWDKFKAMFLGGLSGGGTAAGVGMQAKLLTEAIVNNNQEIIAAENDLQKKIMAQLEALSMDSQTGTGGEETKLTVAEQIQDIQKRLVDAKKTLGDFRLASSIATPEDIETQEKIIKDLEKQLELLTGVKKSKKDVVEKRSSEPISAITPMGTGNIAMPKLATPTSNDILASYYSGNLSSDMIKLFGDLDNLTVNEMLRIKKHIEDNFQNLNLTPDELEALRSRIDQATDEIEKRNPFAALKEALNDYRKDESNINLKKVFAGLSSSIDLVRGSFDAVIGGIESMGIAMDEGTKEMLQDISSLMEGASTLASGIATGNPLSIIQGSISLIASGINLIAGAHDRKIERSIARHKKNIDDLKLSYEELERAIDKALGGDQYSMQKQQLDNLKKQQQEYAAMIQSERDKKKTDSGKVKEYEEQIREAGNAIEDIITSMREDILQTTVSDAAGELGNAIIDAFAAGENAAEAWGKKVDDIVGNVIRKMLIEKLVEQPVGQILNRYMSQWVDSSGNFLGFDAVMGSAALMGQELSALGPGLSTVLENLPDDIKKYLFGDSTNSDATLTGQIKGVSEETASMLSGYINAIRINQIESLNVIRAQLLALDKISANTSHLVQMREVVDQLKALNRVWSTRPQGF